MSALAVSALAASALAELLNWRGRSAESKLYAVRNGISAELIVAPDGGSLHVALVRILIDLARSRKPLTAADRADIAAAESWAERPCEKRQQAAALTWPVRAARNAARAAVQAASAAWAEAETPPELDAIVARHLPRPPPVIIDGVEYDLDDETTRAVIALSLGAQNKP